MNTYYCPVCYAPLEELVPTTTSTKSDRYRCTQCKQRWQRIAPVNAGDNEVFIRLVVLEVKDATAD